MVANSAVGSPKTPSLFARRWRSTTSFLRRLYGYPIAFAGFLGVLVFLTMGLIGDVIAPYPFDAVQPDLTQCVTRANGNTRCAALENAPPSSQHLLGTDRNGRDVLSRLLHGARYTIGLPLVATVFAVILGAFIGLLIGYVGGTFDEIVSRGIDILLSIPAIILALVALSTIVPSLQMSNNALVDLLGATNIALVTVIVLLYTPIVARVTRSSTLSVRERGFIELAKLRGESTLYILLREILPTVIPALTVEASLRFSYAIFLVASLGFLGLGAQPPIPEWGRMVLDARDTYALAPWGLWVPVIAIALLVISVNLMADGLQRIYRREEK